MLGCYITSRWVTSIKQRCGKFLILQFWITNSQGWIQANKPLRWVLEEMTLDWSIFSMPVSFNLSLAMMPSARSSCRILLTWLKYFAWKFRPIASGIEAKASIWGQNLLHRLRQVFQCQNHSLQFPKKLHHPTCFFVVNLQPYMTCTHETDLNDIFRYHGPSYMQNCQTNTISYARKVNPELKFRMIWLTQSPRRKKKNDLVDATNCAIESAARRAGDRVVFVNYDKYYEMNQGRFCEDGVDEPNPNRPRSSIFWVQHNKYHL